LVPLALFSTLLLSGASAQATTPWHRVANIPQPRDDFQAASGSDGKIYAIGGCPGGSCGPGYFTDAVDVYDPTSDTWTHLPTSLPAPRGYAGVAGDGDGHIYVLGGLDNSGDSTGPLMFTIDTGTWTTLPPMPIPNSYSMGAAVGPDGRVYAVGGHYGSRKVQVYDPTTDSWSLAAPLPRPVDEPAVVSVGSRLYAIGGYDNWRDRTGGILRTTFAYDPATNRWHRMHLMPRAHGFGQAAVGADGRIYVVGGLVPAPGCGCLVATRKVIAFDPSTNSWAAGRALPRPMNDQGVARDAAGDIYSISGELANEQVFELPIAP
jgi:N-acetylneuraminic acid mutarotase